jgi:fructose transport system ATP-binding protein
MDARAAGIETVYQTSPSPRRSTSPTTCSSAARAQAGRRSARCSGCSTASTCARGQEADDRAGHRHLQNIGQAVETLSGGQRQGVAVARAAAFGSKVVILDEPTAALGVKESGNRVLELIRDVRDAGCR